jgi:lipopolysaccharide transport system ATP-binding protein
MSNTVVSVENLGKLYRLGEIGTGTISHDLNRWWARVRGKDDPFTKIGEINDRTQKGESEYVWALKDVNFEVKQGEVMGIIGRNGAGKSTLLKILSKVTTPSTGKIKVKGRIASLLEVGTGFHPELTGRENIYLNGAILGMTKDEIRRKFDEIVDFAGVERYIDTPVKRYSSGMYVRLAFAVAAFLEPEILIVDEVLAVGDAEFQQKCLGRMKDVSVNDGRTVLFVSHNLASLKAICQSGLLLKNGRVSMLDTIKKVADTYVKTNIKGVSLLENIQYFTNDVLIRSLAINGSELSSLVLEDNKLTVQLEVELKIKTEFDIELHLKDQDVIVATFAGFTVRELPTLQPGLYRYEFNVALPQLRSNQYQIDLHFAQPYVRWYGVIKNLIELEVHNESVHTFLNRSDIQWGNIVLDGEYTYGKAKVSTIL